MAKKEDGTICMPLIIKLLNFEDNTSLLPRTLKVFFFFINFKNYDQFSLFESYKSIRVI